MKLGLNCQKFKYVNVSRMLNATEIGRVHRLFEGKQ